MKFNKLAISLTALVIGLSPMPASAGKDAIVCLDELRSATPPYSSEIIYKIDKAIPRGISPADPVYGSLAIPPNPPSNKNNIEYNNLMNSDSTDLSQYAGIALNLLGDHRHPDALKVVQKGFAVKGADTNSESYKMLQLVGTYVNCRNSDK